METTKGKLKEIRTELDYTLEEFSMLTGISIANLGYAERNNSLKLSEFNKILKAAQYPRKKLLSHNLKQVSTKFLLNEIEKRVDGDTRCFELEIDFVGIKKELELSDQGVARVFNVTRAQLDNIKTGKSNFKLKKLDKIDVPWFVFWKDSLADFSTDYIFGEIKWRINNAEKRNDGEV